MNDIEIFIDDDVLNGYIVEELEDKVIVLVPERFSRIVEDYEREFEKKPKIILKKKEVLSWIQLPYENRYVDDKEYGKVCLFPKEKYEFIIKNSFN